jgi:tetratricopeptide (TPR) repeat protein
MSDNKQRFEQISAIIKEKAKSLNPSQEDRVLILNLVHSYYRKRIGISNSAPDTMAAAFLWVYSKSNFLWEGDNRWSRQGIAELFNVNPKTTGDAASKIIKALKIGNWDKRFCREDIMKNNPFDQFMMAPSGIIVPKDMISLFESIAKKKRNPKEEYYDKSMDYLEEDNEEKAIESLNKALTYDENYIEAIEELGLIYFDKDIEKSREYYQKAFDLSKKDLGGYWPKELEWGIWENRPYMRAIQGLAMIFWREYEIEEAKKLFKMLLEMNPYDNQGIRYCMAAIYKGLNWEDFVKLEEKCEETGNYDAQDRLLEEQNDYYEFWKDPQSQEGKK